MAKYGDWTFGQVEALLNILGGDEVGKRILSGRMKVVVKDVDIFPLTLNHALTLPQMIALGHYDWVNEDITSEHFPLKTEDRKEDCTLELVHLARHISSDEAEKEIRARGLEPATIAELLAFGAKNPELQREDPIVALGSVAVVGGDRCVAFLHRNGSKRILGLSSRGSGWDDGCRFLARRKPSVS